MATGWLEHRYQDGNRLARNTGTRLEHRYKEAGGGAKRPVLFKSRVRTARPSPTCVFYGTKLHTNTPQAPKRLQLQSGRSIGTRVGIGWPEHNTRAYVGWCSHTDTKTVIGKLKTRLRTMART